ncbi:hypothetical protein GCM10010406_41320 [Streptomyces thermolineatus]|uniref:DUF3800 domain-containing protein n=1 Tax=Streptomyces thermolineatus TaxID=44033 RepID=A0ABP5ZNA9_9ACTN
MRLIFIDDSKTRDCPREHLGELVSVGAVFVPDQAVKPFAEDLDRIRQDLGVPEGEEIKWKPSRGSFLYSAGGEVNGELRKRMLEAARDRGITSAVVLWDRGHKNLPQEQIEPKILEWLYQRIEMHLNDHDDVGMIIADKPGGGPKQESKWLADSLRLTQEGAAYVPAERVVLPMVTAPSDHIPHLQLADIVVAGTTAAVAGRPAGLKLAPLLNELAHKRSQGLAGGAGIVLWPKEIRDLHWWVFKENHYIKGNGILFLPTGVTKGGLNLWTYSCSDGLGKTLP